MSYVWVHIEISFDLGILANLSTVWDITEVQVKVFIQEKSTRRKEESLFAVQETLLRY